MMNAHFALTHRIGLPAALLALGGAWTLAARADAAGGWEEAGVPQAAAGVEAARAAQAAQAEAGQVVRVPVTGTIEMGLAPFIGRAIGEAAEAGAAVVLDIDTQGGRVDAAQKIIDAVTAAPVPVFAYVNPRAYSAGAMIAISAERVFMREGAVMGAATPVDGSGTKASEKIVSAMRAQMRALAELRGLDEAVAAAMVDEDIEIEGVVEAGKLLTLTTSEAVALGYAESVAGWDGVLSAVGMESAEVEQAEVNWAERLVRFFTNPLIAPMLLSLGFLGLFVEIKSPGFGVAGIAGLLSLALFFGAHLLVGLAGAVDLILVGAGVVLVLVEVLVIPGFGVFGIVGGLALLSGLFMAQIGSFPEEGDFGRAATVLLAAAMLIALSIWAFLRSRLGRRGLGRAGIVLPEATDRDSGYTSADLRPELVGAEGVAITDLRPSGVGLFANERVDVVSESEWIEEGAPIRIVAAEGYRHVVRAVGRGRAANQRNPSD